MKIVTLCENHLFSKAYSKGKRCVTDAVAVYVMPDFKANKLMASHPMKIKVNRIGFTATPKIGGATVRSRVRRIMRHGYTALVNERPIKKGFIIVIAARSAAADLKSQDIKRALEYSFNKLNMFEL
jgi:ribonuclease P protein component